ncbi:MAG: translation initiation factor IF-2 [Clostridium sp.]|jgi:translation initiation factor IF-2|nr:translation initiation factor IF-2 [Clostridium sp.]
MAKMKIYEIARSIQQQDKNIKSGDLVTLLNENGFEVKGANSNIEDEAIGFLMNYFKKKKAAAKAEPKEEVKAPVKEEPKVEKKEEPKVEKKVEEKKEEPKVEKKPEEKKPEEKKPEEKKPEEKAEKKPEEKKVSSQKPQQLKKNDNYRKPNNNGQGRNDRNDRNDRDRRNGNGNGSRPDNRGNNGNNNGRRNDRNDRDRRGNNNGQNSRGDNRRNGNGNGNNNRVFERFEKAQSGFDGIKQEQKNSRQRNRKKDDRNNKTGGYRKSTKEEMSRIRSKKDPNRKGAFIKPEPVKQEPEEDIKQITIPESLTIRELADKMKMPAAALVKKLFMQGQMVSLNQEITFDEAEEIALSFDIIAEMEEKVDMVAELLKEEEEDESKMKKRPPVVCVMGHVDHGKTSLLDAIRETDVTEHEAGGITQHIGAYVVRINGEKITFLDTPGHEAFTSMRMRGAQSTDVAVLVVAADDGVMPQTVEAINHAKAAGVEIIVAINKIDKEGANIERVKQELSEYELIPEEWGGSTIFCPVSAHTKEGISNLLEMIILTAEVLELKANPKRRARGIVIEAQLDKGRGPVATVLVQKGTLNVGDHIAVGTAYGKVRAMLDHKGERVKQATPSTPVEILGLNGVPSAGEIFVATENDKEAKQIAQAYVDQGKDKLLEETKAKKLSLDGLFSQIQAGNVKELNLIIKADVQGSVEAVKQSLVKLSNEEVAVRVIHGGVGAINESDVSLASASNAIIIGFNIRLDNAAKETADRENVDVRLYRVIYDAIEDIEAAMKGMLEPIYEEKVIAHAEVRQTFKASGVGTIAGSYVLDGKIERGCRARITREGEQIFEGDLSSLKRFKDDVKEVAAGYECGLVFDGFNDLQEEDQIECYKMVEVPR